MSDLAIERIIWDKKQQLLNKFIKDIANVDALRPQVQLTKDLATLWNNLYPDTAHVWIHEQTIPLRIHLPKPNSTIFDKWLVQILPIIKNTIGTDEYMVEDFSSLDLKCISFLGTFTLEIFVDAD
jgi:hypothetical protein